MAFHLPAHLRKYVVRQEDRSYTPVDHAVWRFCLRQLKSFLSVHAHESYLDGLEKTGIEVEKIPEISRISQKLSAFGWRALPVSGFIPPAAFMELQAQNVLPIASDIRSLDHLEYTPAPDIVHEAAGHAPMLAHPEFAQYLRNYAQVARRAIISKEDMDIYEAIRNLSDLKENPLSTPMQIQATEAHLAKVIAAGTHVSEATWLSRMNWWTAEYGLIGTLENPKIYGAGLLSSVGESKLCLSSKVKKLPLSIDCIEYTYDITEPQPQLFVTPDFSTLNQVLDELASRMAFRVGGRSSIEKAIQAQTVNTVELNSGLQISGLCCEILGNGTEVQYLRFSGPCQLSSDDLQLDGHGPTHHAEGYGTAVGFLRSHPHTCPSMISEEEWLAIGARVGSHLTLEFTSGVRVQGILKSRQTKNNQTLLLAFDEARVTMQDRVLFEPHWGVYDLSLGSAVKSVFGGPADRLNYGETDDFVAKRVPAPVFSDLEKKRHELYQSIRDLRETKHQGSDLESRLTIAFHHAEEFFPQDWLIKLEIYELVLTQLGSNTLTQKLAASLRKNQIDRPDQADVIQDGINLIGK